MNIETPRMIIRDFTLGDAADLHEIFGDDETMENCEPAYDFEKTKEFLTSFCIGRKGAVAAVHKERNKVIGYSLAGGYAHCNRRSKLPSQRDWSKSYSNACSAWQRSWIRSSMR